MDVRTSTIVAATGERKWRSIPRAARIAAAAFVVAVPILGASGVMTAKAATPETFYAVNSTFAFTGHGYGHGHGMSQYGAYGAAVSGLSSAQILDFYYPGTATSAVPPANATVRVLLSGGDGTSMQFSPEARDGTLTAIDLNAGRSAVLPTSVGGAAVDGWRSIAAGDGTTRLQGHWSGAWQAFPAGAGWSSTGAVVITSTSNQLTLVRADGTLRDYLGSLASGANGSTGIYTVNLVSTENYVRGVVPSESPSSWPAAALQAQTVAARTYAVSVASPGRFYDICDTTACQVYSGLATYGSNGQLSRAETTANTDSAVAATAGQIRTYNGAPIFAQYSSSNGGWTVAGGSSTPYLVAKADPYDGLVPNSANTWTQSIDATALGTALGVGRAYMLTVNGRDGNGEWGGRITSVTVAGSAGTVTVSGETFRSSAGLKSTWWTAPAGTLEGSGPSSVSGPSDLYGIALNGTGSQTIELHGLTRASNYAAFGVHSASAFGVSTADDWRFFIAPFNGDGRPDLYGVKLRGGGSGTVEVHVLSAASNYQTFLFHAATILESPPPGVKADFALGSFGGDGRQDLYFIPWASTGSGAVEIHVLSAASGYHSFIGHVATAMPTSVVAAGEWTFLVGDGGGRGDLVAVHGSGSAGSGRTEVHVLSQVSNYQGWIVHAATALGLQSATDVSFKLADFDRDGSLDLVAVLRGATTASHVTEVHILSGREGFQSFLAHAATGLGPTDPSAWQFAVS